MKYDVIIVGAGPRYFSAYELTKKNPSLKVATVFEKDILLKRKCPIDEIK